MIRPNHNAPDSHIISDIYSAGATGDDDTDFDTSTEPQPITKLSQCDLSSGLTAPRMNYAVRTAQHDVIDVMLLRQMYVVRQESSATMSTFAPSALGLSPQLTPSAVHVDIDQHKKGSRCAYH